nr:hypothetical protein [Tanacetum cinerariifolium]
MTKDQSISGKNKMFWHNARDDPMFNTIRVISRHQDTHVYDAIIPVELTNQEMLDSKAYKEYYAVALRAEPLKVKIKYKKKTDESVTSPKYKTASASKGTSLKSKVKVALSEAEQIKLATKRSNKDFYISHASGLGDGVDTQSKVLNEQVQKTSGTDEETSARPGVLDVPPYESESDKESWGDSEDEDGNDDDGDDDAESDDHDDDNDDERTESDSEEIPYPNLTNVNQIVYKEEDVDEGVRTPSENEFTDEEKLADEETMDDKEDNEVFKELYKDVNVNLEKDDVEMTDANLKGSEQLNVSQESGFEQEEKDAHMTLTPNPSLADNEIASLMETTVPHTTVTPIIISTFTTTTPPSPLFFNPLLQQQMPTIPTPTYSNPTLTLPEIPKFAYVFKFDQRTAYAIVTLLLEFELKKILIEKIEANKSIDRLDNQKNLYNALVESYNFEKDIFTSYGDVVLLKRGRDDQDKDEDPSVRSDRGKKRRKSSKDAESSKDSRSTEKKSSSTSKEASQS